MKALSLWQPWATLIAIGAKRIETRHWYTRYRGPLAIHASKRKDSYSLSLCLEEPFKSALARAGFHSADDLPYGKMVATCCLDQCLLITEKGMTNITYTAAIPEMPERAFGNYDLGRFAFILDKIKALPEPIPAIGRQGFFEWMRSSDLRSSACICG